MLYGKTAYIKGSKVTGNIPNNGIISASFNGLDTKSYSIPAGYTSGGSVNLDNTIDNEINEQSTLIDQIRTAVDNLPEANGNGTDNSTGIEWHLCSNLPTSYAIAEPGAVNYYIELPSNNCCVLFYNNNIGAGSQLDLHYGCFDVQVSSGTTSFCQLYGSGINDSEVIEDSGCFFLRISAANMSPTAYYAIIQPPSN